MLQPPVRCGWLAVSCNHCSSGVEGFNNQITGSVATSEDHQALVPSQPEQTTVVVKNTDSKRGKTGKQKLNATRVIF
jgi:hypothetical protein